MAVNHVTLQKSKKAAHHVHKPQQSVRTPWRWPQLARTSAMK
jgi:hypothetical protein